MGVLGLSDFARGVVTTLLSLPETTNGYVLHAGAGEALGAWFGGGRLTITAAAAQTEGRYVTVEFWGPHGFGSPVHVHSDEDEVFVVLDGEVRFRLGDEVTDAEPRSVVFGPRGCLTRSR